VSEHMTPKQGPEKFAANSTLSFTCNKCSNSFRTKQEYSNHRAFSPSCSDAFGKQRPKTEHKGYVDLDQPKTQTVNDVLGYGDSSDVAPEDLDDSSDTPTDLSDGEKYCHNCKNRFLSMAKFNGHFLGCRSRNDSPMFREAIQAPLSTVEQSSSSAGQHASNGPRSLTEAARPLQTATNMVPRPQLPASSPLPSTTVAPSAMFVCNVNGCGKAFRAEPALNVHKKDAHGVGGKGLDLYGKDSYMLSQRMRTQFQQEGLLHPAPSGPSRGRGPVYTSKPHQTPPGRSVPVVRLPPRPPFGPAHQVPQYGSARPPPINTVTPTLLPPVGNMATEIEQAKFIQGKILRLLIQSDIFIHNDGKMTVCGQDWNRISVVKQQEAVGNFDSMVHLPKVLQSEYLPPPKTFLSEYKLQYPVSEFQASPQRNRSKPGLSVVVISCAKVILADGLQDVVKIAAVDLITCRILMNHLVCTDPKVAVKDWRTRTTGLFSWDDMEEARKLGYKVFKGWSAARSALWKFVDNETIIVGHNLRSDLDALRMVHGRAVDIAKVAEKAAKGPLSKAQLSLESMVRDNLNVRLAGQDGEFGRDCLLNAFATRQFNLHVIKNREKFDKDMRQRSQEYQLLTPRVAAA
jgi:hypothetical protein